MTIFRGSARPFAFAVATALLMAACSSSPAPVADAPAAAPKTDASKTDAPKTDAPKSDAPKSVACTDPRPQLCTMEYAPVCATRDTGVRCITTPCPSSELKTYSTGCTACSDAKVSSWVQGACPGG
jgi:hypothetical protein